MDDASKLQALRDALPAVKRYSYFNTGTYGPMSSACEQAMRERHLDELANGRISPDGFQRASKIKEEGRATLARLVNATPENIALTRHTTEGMNIAVFGYNWQPGDEIVTTTVEHGGGLLPVRLAERRHGVTVRVVDLSDGRGGDISAAVAKQLTAKTKLVAISHVSFATGACYDMQRVVQVCHQRGVPVAIDGAQSVGAIPVDVSELDVDYYAFSGQKWLMGPSGTGGLYVRSDRLGEIQPPLIGTGAVSSHEDLDHYILWPDARKFEGATTANLATIAGLTASVKWLLEDVGLQWAQARSKKLVGAAQEGLKKLPKIEVITPKERANLVCFRVAGQAPADVVGKLREGGVVVRAVSETNCARFSIGFYNTEEEVEKAVDLVRRIAS